MLSMFFLILRTSFNKCALATLQSLSHSKKKNIKPKYILWSLWRYFIWRNLKTFWYYCKTLEIMNRRFSLFFTIIRISDMDNSEFSIVLCIWRRHFSSYILIRVWNRNVKRDVLMIRLWFKVAAFDVDISTSQNLEFDSQLLC